METLTLIILAVIVVLLVVQIIMNMNAKGGGADEEIRKLGSQLKRDVDSSVSNMGQLISSNMTERLELIEKRISTLETGNEQKLEQMRETISKRLLYIQEDNNKKLDEMRSAVDERLQKSLEGKISESFKTVSEQLAAVYKGLGEMQTIAAGVGDLKKVLSNVKTRGILGEIQLGSILSEILTPDQYDTETATRPGSRDHVEFAIKLPAKENGGFIYLPIDSKFPGDTYAALQDAFDAGDPEVIKNARKALEAVIKKSAKDIRDKYIEPPYTTSFAIMFLPFEGLYAEVVNLGLVEILQRDYSINIAGPSTMAAMLNSLQMGFQTLQIQKRSNEVWALLANVKKEFESFDKVLSSAQTRIHQLDDEMEKLVGVRTRAIRKSLDKVELLENSEG
ncbi:MAG: DNA recombination protein RmuC [Ruminococcus sp.]|nr:DNA recombination protein RmuC [Ruminococcus sp.]